MYPQYYRLHLIIRACMIWIIHSVYYVQKSKWIFSLCMCWLLSLSHHSFLFFLLKSSPKKFNKNEYFRTKSPPIYQIPNQSERWKKTPRALEESWKTKHKFLTKNRPEMSIFLRRRGRDWVVIGLLTHVPLGILDKLYKRGPTAHSAVE